MVLDSDEGVFLGDALYTVINFQSSRYFASFIVYLGNAIHGEFLVATSDIVWKQFL